MIPKLKDPGVGPPWIARAFNRFIVKPFVIRPTTWDASMAALRQALPNLESQFQKFSGEQLIVRVLVPPQTGLEDSSRYWSAALTARHLTIVGQAIEQAIIALTHNRSPKQKADTAKVKPEANLNTLQALQEYRTFSENLTERIQTNVGDLQSSLKHVHPWFGPLTAKDWLWLLGVHSLIHLKQLRAIHKKLVSDASA